MSSGTKNSVGDFLRSVFSTLVNRDDEVFKALFANPDDESGIAETIFNQLEASRDEWCNNSDVYNQSGELLEKTLSFFSVLTRSFDESDDSIKNRNQLLYHRNGDTLWGDRWNIIKLFKTFFFSDYVYIVNNTDDSTNNLIQDGDFEEDNGAWILDSCEFNEDARFSKRFGLKLSGNGRCYQSVNVDADSVYFLHYFQKGYIGIEITDNNGRYWKPANENTDKFGSWVDYRNMVLVQNNNKWNPEDIFFITDGLVSTVTVSFIGTDGEETYLDYIRLFKKHNYSIFTLIVCAGEKSTSKTLGMASGTDDPNMEMPNYKIISYMDHANILGNIGVSAYNHYSDLFEIVKPSGITGYIEVLSSNFVE